MDLVSRSGLPNSESMSPYNGLREEILLKNIVKDDHHTIVKLLENELDFNADKSMPAFKEEYSASTALHIKTYGLPYARNLEDIDVSWLSKYIENLLYSVRYHNTNSTKYLCKKTQMTRKIIDNEDGEAMTEGDLAVRDTSIKNSMICRIHDTLVEAMLKLYKCGNDLGVSMFGFVRAYELLNKYKSKPQRTKYRDYGVYTQTTDYNIGSYISNVNVPKVVNAIAIVQGDLQEYQTYTKACRTFSYCLAEIGIDIERQDPKQFNRKMYDILLSKCKLINTTKIADILNDISFTTEKKKRTLAENVKNKYEQFNAAILSKGNIDVNIQQCVILIAIMSNYRRMKNPAIPIRSFKDNYEFIKGMLYTNLGTIALLDVSDICRVPYDAPKPVALLHETGYLILFNESDNALQTLKVTDAINQYKWLVDGIDISYYHRGNNIQFGVWDSVFC